MAVFDDDLRTYVPSSANPNHIKTIVQAASQTDPKEKTSIEPICHAMAEKISRRGLICLVSDLFTDIDSLIRGLQHFRHCDHEVIVLHIMDEDELTFPFQGHTQFKGLEDLGQVTVEPRALREGYLDAVNKFCREVKRKCVANQIDYKLISTSDHMDAALLAFLSARAAAAKKAAARK